MERGEGFFRARVRFGRKKPGLNPRLKTRPHRAFFRDEREAGGVLRKGSGAFPVDGRRVGHGEEICLPQGA